MHIKKSLYQILLCKLSRVGQRPLLKLHFIEEDETITYKFPQLTLLTLSYFSKAWAHGPLSPDLPPRLSVSQDGT